MYHGRGQGSWMRPRVIEEARVKWPPKQQKVEWIHEWMFLIFICVYQKEYDWYKWLLVVKMYYVLIRKNHSQLREPCLYIKGSKVMGLLVSVNMKGNQDKFSTFEGLRDFYLPLGIVALEDWPVRLKFMVKKNKERWTSIRLNYLFLSGTKSRGQFSSQTVAVIWPKYCR